MKKIVCGFLVATAIAGSSNGSIVKAETTDITIDAKATTVNMTVPGTVAVIFNEDGSNAYPENLVVTNGSKISGVYLSSVEMDAGVSGWKLVDDSIDTTKLPIDSKSIRVRAGKDGLTRLIEPSVGSEDTEGVANYGVRDVLIPAMGSQKISFAIDRGAFSSNQGLSNAFSMQLNFDYAVGQSYLTTGSDFNAKIADMKATAKGIEFVNALSDVPGAIDVSSNNDKSVVAYLDGTTIKVAFDGALILNADSSGLFAGVNASNGFIGGQYLDSSQVVDASSMFRGFTGPADSSWFNWLNVSNIENGSYMFSASNVGTFTMSGYDFAKLTNADHMFSINGGMFSIKDLSFPVLTNADNMFMGAKTVADCVVDNLHLENVTSAISMFESSTIHVKTLHFSDGLKTVNRMFYGFKGPGSAYPSDLDMRNWGMGGVTSATEFLSGYGVKGTIYVFDTKSLVNADNMFSNVTNATINLDSCTFDSLKSANSMLAGNPNAAITLNDKVFPVLTSANSMFKGNTYMGPGGVSKVSNLSFPVLTNADSMLAFQSMSNLDVYDINSFKFGNLVSANNMMTGLSSVANLDLSKWGDMSKLASANSFIDYCTATKGDLGISNWNLGSLTNANAFLGTVPYFSGSITIRNASTVMTFGTVSAVDGTQLKINYVDEATNAKAQEIVASAGNSRIVLGSLVK